ncbi:MAG: hypothetical protein AAGL49_05530 [Pseudomonadota bacterium]
MRLSDQQKRKLQHLLSALPFPAASRLMVELERQKLAGAEGLPHEAMLEALRGPVATGDPRPPRTPTPLRLFCTPFEDLLYNGRSPSKDVGRISRDTIAPLWAWLQDDLIPDEVQALSKKLVRAVLDGDQEARRIALADLHRRSAVILAEELERADKDRGARRAAAMRFGDARALDDVREIAAVIEFAPEIAKVQADFPRPVDRVHDEDLTKIKGHYQTFVDHMPHLAPYLFLIVMGRMKRPWELLGVVGRISHAEDDRLISASSDMGAIGERLLGDAERIAEIFRQESNADTPVETVLRELEQFTDLVQGLVRELGVRRDGPWGQRIFAARQVASDAMERRLELALKAIRAAMPVRRAGEVGVFTSRPDLEADLDKTVFASAVDGARFISEARYYARQAAFAAAHADISERAVKEVQDYSAAIIQELRAAEPQSREAAQPLADAVADMIAHLDSPENADVFRRRSAAAEAA